MPPHTNCLAGDNMCSYPDINTIYLNLYCLTQHAQLLTKSYKTYKEAKTNKSIMLCQETKQSVEPDWNVTQMVELPNNLNYNEDYVTDYWKRWISCMINEYFQEKEKNYKKK